MKKLMTFLGIVLFCITAMAGKNADLTNFENIKVSSAYKISSSEDFLVRFETQVVEQLGGKTPNPRFLESSTIFYCKTEVENTNCYQQMTMGGMSQGNIALSEDLLVNLNNNKVRARWEFDKEKGLAKFQCPDQKAIKIIELNESEIAEFTQKVKSGQIQLVGMPVFYEPLIILKDPILEVFYSIDRQANLAYPGKYRLFVGKLGNLEEVSLKAGEHSHRGGTSVLLTDGTAIVVENKVASFNGRTLQVILSNPTAKDAKTLGLDLHHENIETYVSPCK